VTWLLPPELDDGEEPELKPPEPSELELDPVEVEPEEELEPELVPEPGDVEPEPELAEPEDVEPELAEPVDVEPVEAEPEDVEPVEAPACVDPGRTSANAPAATTLATAATVVAVLTLPRPRSLAAIAWRIPSPFVLLMSYSLGARTRSSLREPSL
jgi:hypothetical protein